MGDLEPQLAYSDNQIAALTHGDERVRRPQGVPDIGPATAVTFGAGLDERMTGPLRAPHRANSHRALDRGSRFIEAT